jgi:hypothetical protein
MAASAARTERSTGTSSGPRSTSPSTTRSGPWTPSSTAPGCPKAWRPSARPPTTTPRARRRWSGTRSSRLRCPSSSSPTRPSTPDAAPRSSPETASPTPLPSCERDPLPAPPRRCQPCRHLYAARFHRRVLAVINPVALRAPVFGELEMPLGLSLVEARTFDDTVVLVCYAHRRRHERRASVQLCTAR